jgi:deoxyribose-phosphate aldolase
MTVSNVNELAGVIDHTLLKPEATSEQIRRLCEEAKQYGFCAVSINPRWVALAADLLHGSNVAVGGVASLPLGADFTIIKVAQAKEAIMAGADEIDMVANIGALKSGDFKLVEEDIKAVRSAIGKEKILKVIIETAVLTNEEKIRATQIIMACEADFVKTSTGFGYPGATVEDIKLLKKVGGDKIRIKASGGIRDYETALKLIEAGASRIGTSSGVKIVEQSKSSKN